jgi:hypothetical protein
MGNKFIKVLWLKPHYKYAYNKGDNGVVDADLAPGLMAEGFILPVPDTEVEKDNPLPHDLPARTILFNSGFETLAAIKEAGDSLLDAGISKGTLTKVKAYLAK